MQRKRDAGVNEVIASILIVALVIALAIIIGSIVFGVIVIQPKSAYIPPRVEVVNYSGQQAISLSSRGGDPAVLDKGDGVQYALGIYVENSSVSSRVTPDAGVGTFGPGQTLYIYYHNGEYRVTDNLTGKVFGQLPPGPLTLRLVDENARLLVYKEGIGLGGSAGPIIPPPIPSCGTITGIVYNDLNGNGQRNPGEPGLSGWTIQYRSRNKPSDPWSAWTGTSTGVDGVYVFSSLPYLTVYFYEVRVVVPGGWFVTHPTTDYSFHLNPDDKCYATGIDFGIRQI
ncbi:MAG TPA: SdrD B-like domain-containing protein [Methanolinea sp.]|nr:SdrD B-like domain-containing protein [Methanolinea sp.]